MEGKKLHEQGVLSTVTGERRQRKQIATTTGNMHKKLGEVRPHSFQVMHAGRQTYSSQ